MKWEKRALDLLGALFGLLFLILPGMVVGTLIFLEDRGPVFFRQTRIGRKGKPFRIWKFRTMIVQPVVSGFQLTVGSDPRITRVGHWLRKTKIDELPQLLNVLVGEMSLVGPRPEVPRYVARYSDNQRLVLNLTPGITDLASIQFRHESDLLAMVTDPEHLYMSEIMPAKISINVAYAEKATVWTDIGVILKTFGVLFR